MNDIPSNPNPFRYNEIHNQGTVWEQTVKSIPQVGGEVRGALLSKGAESIPLEAYGIMNQGNDPSRPFLPPVSSEIQAKLFPNRDEQNAIHLLFDVLLSQYSEELQVKLKENDQLPFEIQDPDFVGYRLFLTQISEWMTKLETFSKSTVEEETILSWAKKAEEFSAELKENNLKLVGDVQNKLEIQLKREGSASPEFEKLINLYNGIQQAIDRLEEGKR